MAVAAIVLEHGGTEDEAIAALLHDAVEDQGGRATGERIRAEFGDAVAGIVYGCSDSDTAVKGPWRERKERYIAHVRSEKNASVRLVSAADKLHNARSILADYRVLGEKLWDRFSGRRDGTLWYYRSLVAAFRETGTAPPLVDELARVVDELVALVAGHSRPGKP